MADIVVFYIFAGISLAAAAGVVFHPNPVVSVLHLVAAMVGVSGLFFTLGAPFIGMVQILVYAGAVIILFLFVVMIFDLKTDGKNPFTYGLVTHYAKLLFIGCLTGLLLSKLLFKLDGFEFQSPDPLAPQYEVRNLAKVMFTDYMFMFEVLGLLLLVIPIGAVALSRVRGGTHAE